MSGCLRGESSGSIHKPYPRLTQTGGPETLEHGRVKFVNPRDLFSPEETKKRVFGQGICPRPIKDKLGLQGHFGNNIPVRSDYLQKVRQPEFQNLCLFYYPTALSIQLLQQTWNDRFLCTTGLAQGEELATARPAGIKSTWMWAIINRKPSRGQQGDLPLVVVLYAQCIFHQVTGENLFKSPDMACLDSVGRRIGLRVDPRGGIRIPRLKSTLDANSPHPSGTLLPYE